MFVSNLWSTVKNWLHFSYYYFLNNYEHFGRTNNFKTAYTQSDITKQIIFCKKYDYVLVQKQYKRTIERTAFHS